MRDMLSMILTKMNTITQHLSTRTTTEKLSMSTERPNRSIITNNLTFSHTRSSDTRSTITLRTTTTVITKITTTSLIMIRMLRSRHGPRITTRPIASTTTTNTGTP